MLSHTMSQRYRRAECGAEAVVRLRKFNSFSNPEPAMVGRDECRTFLSLHYQP